MRDADTFFGQELPSFERWSLRREDAARIAQPVLSVVGAKSQQLSPIWTERHQMVLAWMHPRAVTEALTAFFTRHPVKAP